MPPEKRCSRCNETKSTDEFHRSKGDKDGLYGWCKACRKDHRNDPKVRAQLRNNSRNGLLNRVYGINQEIYHSLLTTQSSGCAICHVHISEIRREWLDVDHCHITGEVRGLLCDICNRAIGLFKDNPDTLRQAAAYLERKRE